VCCTYKFLSVCPSLENTYTVVLFILVHTVGACHQDDAPFRIDLRITCITFIYIDYVFLVYELCFNLLYLFIYFLFFPSLMHFFLLLIFFINALRNICA